MCVWGGGAEGCGLYIEKHFHTFILQFVAFLFSVNSSVACPFYPRTLTSSWNLNVTFLGILLIIWLTHLIG